MLFRKYARYLRAKTYGYQDVRRLGKIIEQIGIKGQPTNKDKKILFAVSLGGEIGVVRLESFLGAVLKYKGVESHFLLCDKFLSACQLCTYKAFNDDINNFIINGPSKLFCTSCYTDAKKAINTCGFKVHTYSEYVSNAELDQINSIVNTFEHEKIEDWEYEGIPVGEHAYAGALRFYTRSTLDKTKEANDVLKRYFEAALKTTFAIKNLLAKGNFDCVVAHHGIYVPQGLIVQVAKAMNIRVVTWNVAYRKKTFIFSHGDTYHHTLMNEPNKNWEAIPWDKKKEKQLFGYIDSRLKGTGDWITFQSKNNEINKSNLLTDFISKNNGINVALLTNVLWDAQVHYEQNAFDSMLEWIYYTIEYFKDRNDLNLIIRIHPAEVRNKLPSKQLIFNEINKRYQTLPQNVLVLDALSDVTSYEVAQESHCCLIYGTKMGVELSAMGNPIIVAGEAWIRNKGLTYDAKSKSEYRALLDQIPEGIEISAEQIELAKKYAYHFFFRRMIPLDGIDYNYGTPPFKIDLKQAKQVIQHPTKSINTIIDGLRYQKSFIYDE